MKNSLTTIQYEDKEHKKLQKEISNIGNELEILSKRIKNVHDNNR